MRSPHFAKDSAGREMYVFFTARRRESVSKKLHLIPLPDRREAHRLYGMNPVYHCKPDSFNCKYKCFILHVLTRI
jgi:hypothetical protein